MCRVFVWEITVNIPFQKTHIGNLTCIIPVRIPSQNTHLEKLTCNFLDDTSKSIRDYCDASSGKSLCYAMLDHIVCAGHIWFYALWECDKLLNELQCCASCISHSDRHYQIPAPLHSLLCGPRSVRLIILSRLYFLMLMNAKNKYCK